jgi:hypothetical protein
MSAIVVRPVEELREYEVRTEEYPYTLRVIMRRDAERLRLEVRKSEVPLATVELLSRDLDEEAVVLRAASEVLKAVKAEEARRERG